MTLSKTQLVGHVLERHDSTYYFATRAAKSAIDKDHRRFHALVDCDHSHDEGGRVVPVVETLQAGAR